MSEADLMNVVQGIISNSIATFAVFVSLVGGYLVTAYLAGKNLTRSQTVIISTLFFVFVALNIQTQYNFIELSNIYM